MGSLSLSETILSLIDKLEGNDLLDTLHISSVLSEDHQKVIGAVKSLQTIDNLIEVEEKTVKAWELTDEGHEVAQRGLFSDSLSLMFIFSYLNNI